MTFTITYRQPTGALGKEVVEAATRAEALEQAKARGIVPVAVKEGGARAVADKVAAKPAWVKGAVAGVVVVVLASVAVFCLMPSATPAPKVETPKKVKAEKPKPVPKPRASAPVATNAAPVTASKTNTRDAVKNPWGTPIPKDLEYKPHWEYTEEDYARIDPSYKERHEKFKKRQAANPWKTTSDSQLSVLLFSPLGQPNLLIPFSPRFKDLFLKSLETPIVVHKDDAPELQAQKKQMIEARIWLKEQLDEGHDIVQILNAEYERQKKVFGLRENLLKELRALEKTAKTVQEVQDYVDAANQMLEEAGGEKVALPMALTKIRIAREAQEKEQKK